MTFEIGHLSFQQIAPASPAAAAGPQPAGSAPAAGIVDRSDVLPAGPPAEVLAEVDAAWDRAAQLAAGNRELHFERDEATGRVIIEVRTLDGEVLKTIPPAKALDVMSGAPL
jgi:hypothetical protein